MLEAMFGDGPKIDIKDLDTETVQEMWAKAQKAKADVAQKQGKPSAFNKSLIITKLPLVPKYGINSDYWPELVQVREWCDKKQDKVDKLYYQSHICKIEPACSHTPEGVWKYFSYVVYVTNHTLVLVVLLSMPKSFTTMSLTLRPKGRCQLCKLNNVVIWLSKPAYPFIVLKYYIHQ